MERATLSVKIDGQRLRDLRKRRGESVSQIARRAKISVQYLSFIERGERNPLPAVFDRICDAMELADEVRTGLVLKPEDALLIARSAS